MSGSAIKYLGSQPIMTVLRGLMLSSRPRHIRDLASQYSFSPAGVSDIIRRLNETGVLTEVRQGNRRCFSLNLSALEAACLSDFFSIFQNALLKERSVRFSRNAADKLKWMNQAYEFYRDVKKLKKLKHDSP